MILALALLLQSAVIYADPGDAPPVPDAAQHAYSAYVLCLMEPLEPAVEGRGPTDPAARRALVRDALATCHAQRVATVAEMEAKAPRTGKWADTVWRKARIDEIIGKAEQRMSFSILSPDEFRAAIAEIWKCMNAGGGDTCRPTQHPN